MKTKTAAQRCKTHPPRGCYNKGLHSDQLLQNNDCKGNIEPGKVKYVIEKRSYHCSSSPSCPCRNLSASCAAEVKLLFFQ